MIYEFKAPDYYDIWEQIEESEDYEGRDYEKVAEEDGIEYYADQYSIECPQLGVGFRCGLAGEVGEESCENDFDVMIVYDLEEGFPTGISDIYSNTSIPGIIAMAAGNLELEEDAILCKLIVPEV